jgi:hypothetical protein
MAVPRSGARFLRAAAVAGALALIVLILWIDVTTAVWQEVVILSGLAAGLVTFLLTVLVLDRVIARSTARRWDPVNRLALTEFLHAIADDDRSSSEDAETPTQGQGSRSSSASAQGSRRTNKPEAC